MGQKNTLEFLFLAVVAQDLNIILLFVSITSCSLHKNSKFWTKEKIVEEKKENKVKK